MPDYGHELAFGKSMAAHSRRPEEAVALARLAEQVGLDLATFQDHPYQPRLLDTWMLFVVGRGADRDAAGLAERAQPPDAPAGGCYPALTARLPRFAFGGPGFSGPRRIAWRVAVRYAIRSSGVISAIAPVLRT
jgi:hypothetical protein